MKGTVPVSLDKQIASCFDAIHKRMLDPADSNEAARVFRACTAHRSNLMPPTIPI
jgi:hypothetical protein